MPLSLELGLIYLISEVLLTVTRRSRSRTGTKQDMNTLRVLWLVITASIAVGSAPATRGRPSFAGRGARNLGRQTGSADSNRGATKRVPAGKISRKSQDLALTRSTSLRAGSKQDEKSQKSRRFCVDELAGRNMLLSR
jgi:hypothetical protein